MTQVAYVKKDHAVVNTDYEAFKAAKLRKQRDQYIKSLEYRINNLENCVECLTKTIEEIKAHECE